MVPKISVSGSVKLRGSWLGSILHAEHLISAAYEFDGETKPIL
jgi:hypothetical protein